MSMTIRIRARVRIESEAEALSWLAMVLRGSQEPAGCCVDLNLLCTELEMASAEESACR